MVLHTIYLIRHGNSQGNAEKVILHPDKDILNDIGKKQAASLGVALADVEFTLAFSSDYARTMETSEIVLSKSNHSKNIPLVKDIRLREKDFGAYEGESYLGPLTEIGRHLMAGKPGFEWYPKNAETWEDMLVRSDKFFTDLCITLDKSDKPETVMLTSHAFNMQTFMKYLHTSEKLQVTNWNDSAIKVARNCSYMKFTVEGRPDGYASEKRPLNILKLHEWGHLDQTDSLIEFAKSERGKPFASCIQT